VGEPVGLSPAADAAERPAATFPSHRVVRNRRRNDVRRRAGLLRAPGKPSSGRSFTRRSSRPSCCSARIIAASCSMDRLTDLVKAGAGWTAPRCETDGGGSRPAEQRHRDISSAIPRLHQQDGRTEILRRQARLWRAVRADRRHQGVVIASDLRRRHGSWRPEIWQQFADEVRAGWGDAFPSPCGRRCRSGSEGGEGLSPRALLVEGTSHLAASRHLLPPRGEGRRTTSRNQALCGLASASAHRVPLAGVGPL